MAEPPKVRINAPEAPKTEAEAAAAALRPKPSEPDSGETVELGQRSGPVDLDTPVIMGFDEEGQPVASTVREILAGHKDDDDLIHAMNNCLLK